MRIVGWVIVSGIAACALAGSSLPEGTGLSPARAASSSGGSEPAREAEEAERFEHSIAPLLRRHCIECHGRETKKGRLDLSRRDAAFEGGKKGEAIVPGNAAESLAWEYVESDRMPKKRPPLSPREKTLLRDWIERGAVWPEGVELEPPGDEPTGAEWVRRLTVPEYIETVRSATGVDIERDARRILPRDLRADGFSNTAYNLNVDLGHVEAYAHLARLIAGRMDIEAFAKKHAPHDEVGKDRMRQAVARIGKRLLRGPLDEREVDAFLRIAVAVSEEGGDFEEAVRYVVEAMLQSPRFVYRIEKQRADGSPEPAGPWELASRLSYIIWGGPPDDELFRAAGAGELADRGKVEEQVRRMLEDPRARARSIRFLEEWLNLDRLANLRPNRERFPRWDDALAADMRDETVAFFEHVVWEEKRPLSSLLNAQVAFITPRLAHHYGLEWSRVAGGAAEESSKTGAPAADKKQRIDGLQALYTFDDVEGDTVRDVSGTGKPLDLEIEDGSAVRRRPGELTVTGSTRIIAPKPAKRLIDAARKSREATLEVWITPADTRQAGPARILTLSSGTGERNFTLGQDGDRYEVRFRADGTSRNGLPGVQSPRGAVETRLTHVVYTRDKRGRAKLYIDGEERARSKGKRLEGWDSGYRLGIANESTKDRPWRGTFHLVAIYDRALAEEEVRSRAGGLRLHDVSSVPSRGGLLTQGSTLTVGGDEASMVARGLFVLHDFLDGSVDDPPPCVDTTPVPSKPGRSQRKVAEARIADPSCGGCHSRFEPLAFGLEKFDGLGAYHERDEHGNTLRDDGEILFPGEDEPVPYESSAELMDLLAESARVRECITRKLAQFALGRPLVPADSPILEEILEPTKESGGTYTGLITAIVMSDLVQLTRTESVE